MLTSEAGLNHKINKVLVCLSDILLTYLRLNWVSPSPETTTLNFAFNIIIFYKFSSSFRWLTHSAFIKYFIMITVELICIAICCCCLFSFPTLCGLLSVAQFSKKKKLRWEKNFLINVNLIIYGGGGIAKQQKFYPLISD